jgi:hypothetical protein
VAEEQRQSRAQELRRAVDDYIMVLEKESERKAKLAKQLDLLVRHHPVVPSLDTWLSKIRDYVPNLRPDEEEWCKDYLARRGYEGWDRWREH